MWQLGECLWQLGECFSSILSFLHIGQCFQCCIVTAKWHTLFWSVYQCQHLYLVHHRDLHRRVCHDFTLREWILLSLAVRQRLARRVHAVTLELLWPWIPAMSRSMQNLAFPFLETLVLSLGSPVDLRAPIDPIQPDLVLESVPVVMHLGALLAPLMTSAHSISLWTRGPPEVEKELISLSRSFARSLHHLGLFPDDFETVASSAASSYLRGWSGLALGSGYELFDAEIDFAHLHAVRRLCGRIVLDDSACSPFPSFRVNLKRVLVALSTHCSSLVTLGIALESGRVPDDAIDIIAKFCPQSLQFLVLHLDVGTGFAKQPKFSENLCHCFERAGRNTGLQILSFSSFNLCHKFLNICEIPFGVAQLPGYMVAIENAMLAWVCRQGVALSSNSLFGGMLYDAKWYAVEKTFPTRGIIYDPVLSFRPPHPTPYGMVPQGVPVPGPPLPPAWYGSAL